MIRKVSIIISIIIFPGCGLKEARNNQKLAEDIAANSHFLFVKQKAVEIMKTGFTAGEGYGEIWIRDYNTFVELAADVFEPAVLREHLLVFFRMQGGDGNIMDGFIPVEEAKNGYEYIYSESEPRYAGHKNTVETDQESSLVQAVYKYIRATGDSAFLAILIGAKSVGERLNQAMEYLMRHRFDEKYGLIWGATTSDWGDVQPEHEWGVFINEQTHYAIDIYDNAMFLIALDNLMELIPGMKRKWQPVRDRIAGQCRKHLWDSTRQKFIPHIYIHDSPFPGDFDENLIYYHGGTAIAIEADLLTKGEIMVSLQKMVMNRKAAGAASIGLSVFPPYPAGYFKNQIMAPYNYQNGGDWTWFGGRMIQQLIRNGFISEAYEQIQPMVERVHRNNGFFEWYTIDNQPRGSGTYRGSAGVLYKAVKMFEEFAAGKTGR